MTCAAPRTAGNAASSASAGGAGAAQQRRPGRAAPSAARPTSRCSVETYSSPSAVISSCPAISTPWAGRTAAARRRWCRWRWAGRPDALGAPEQAGVGTPTASSRPAGPAGLREQRGQQVHRLDVRVPGRAGGLHGGGQGLLALGGELQVHRSPPERDLSLLDSTLRLVPIVPDRTAPRHAGPPGRREEEVEGRVPGPRSPDPEGEHVQVRVGRQHHEVDRLAGSSGDRVRRTPGTGTPRRRIRPGGCGPC